MKLLLDTHALIWWVYDNSRLPAAAREAMALEENEVLVSAVSAMEIATKHRIGKLPGVEELAEKFAEVIGASGFAPLGVTVAHAQLAGLLAIPHNDPFDRLLIAQAQLEQAILVSNEVLFERFGIRRAWE